MRADSNCEINLLAGLASHCQRACIVDRDIGTVITPRIMYKYESRKTGLQCAKEMKEHLIIRDDLLPFFFLNRIPSDAALNEI